MNNTARVKVRFEKVGFPHDYGSMHQNLEHDVVMAAFHDEYKEMVDKLDGQENMLSVVSIVAMGGVEKTTLARKVYTCPRIKQRFEILRG